MSTTNITLSPDQQRAYDTITKWFESQRAAFLDFDASYIRLGGYAGTGKTTLVALLREALDIEHVYFLAYTGKATINMQEKLVENGTLKPGDSVSTIHSFLYKPVIDTTTGRISDWKINPSYEPGYNDPDLLIIDEASMVPQKIHEDLLSLQLPILYVGDHGQLPPIRTKDEGNDKNFNLMGSPDIRLENIHRQALDSPIIYLSMLARRGEQIKRGSYSQDGSVARVRSIKEVENPIRSGNFNDIFILVDLNRRRLRMNKMVLKMLNLSTQVPEEGSRVVCLKNNWRTSPILFNGQLGTITKAEDGGLHHIRGEVELDADAGVWKGVMSRYWFNNHNPDIPQSLSWRDIGNRFDFGYALTVHKAQGSEADTVYILGDGFAFRQSKDKWLYTAITRAKKKLYICDDRI